MRVLESRREPARDADMRSEVISNILVQLVMRRRFLDCGGTWCSSSAACSPRLILNAARSAPGASSWRRSPRFLILTTRYAPRCTHETFWVSDMEHSLHQIASVANYDWPMKANPSSVPPHPACHARWPCSVPAACRGLIYHSHPYSWVHVPLHLYQQQYI